MNAHDRRQLESMKDQLDAYKSGRIDLDALISSIESLLGVAETISSGWLDELRKHWGILEQVYSVAIVQEKSVATPRNAVLVETAVMRMRAMIDEALRAAEDHE